MKIILFQEKIISKDRRIYIYLKLNNNVQNQVDLKKLNNCKLKIQNIDI